MGRERVDGGVGEHSHTGKREGEGKCGMGGWWRVTGKQSNIGWGVV